VVRHGIPPLVFALAVASGAPATAQVVAGWAHESASGVEFAFFTEVSRRQELAVRCKGPAVEVVYYMDAAALDPALKGRPDAIFAVALDDSAEYRWKSTRMISEPGVASIGIGGQDADLLARDFAAATRKIVVSIFTETPTPASNQYNTATFPIYGAADAIKTAFARCGIRF
jgi:hypothetical protein